jgi:serine/threonine protein kinase
VVWEARQQPSGRLLAVKLFHRPVVAKGEVGWLSKCEQLLRVITLHDARLDHQPPFLVMPLMAGSLQQESLTPPRQVAKWLEQMCHGLQSLHQGLGMCHCDLKPSNILIDKRRDLYLADFGKAAYLGGEGGHLGTPGFMPPEQALLVPPQGPHGLGWDIYGLGATGHYLLTGDFPRVAKSFCDSLQGLELEELLARYRASLCASDEDLRGALRGRNIPPAMAEFLDGCLRLDPEERYSDTEELLGRARWLRRQL